ncbi:YaiI/YqxD family protein [Bacillus massiliigorillae]|uniref:YaiI/YqxD family protein n=1 Tax=Bacillus massiliigorillae TaxID=1243664 RepID=UPI00039FB31C|nr:YaiI/YqxD family protein [Bacillus massiliigorillae]
MTYKPSIIVDGDACPVKDECIACAKEFQVDVVFVASIKNKTNKYPEARWIYVDWDKEAADLYMMNMAKKDDIAVTSDIGLAAALLGKGVCVLSPKGIFYNEYNIDSLLFMRHTAAKKRRKGVYSKGPKAFTENDRKNFHNSLVKILSNFAGK